MDKSCIRSKAIYKVKNAHYFERYLRIIGLFKINNILLPQDTYVESHHILPKANDMFPEYENFKEYPWNEINLTARQHFIAHWILWKAFGRSQSYAFQCFIDQVNCKNNRRQNLKVTSRVYEELKIQNSAYQKEIRKGKASYIDKEGNTAYCRTDDPRVLSGELISTSKGRKHGPRGEEQKRKLKKSLLKYHRNKKDQPDVSFYRDIEKVMVPKYSDEYNYYMSSKEWSTKCTAERKTYIAVQTNKNRENISWSEESRKRMSDRLSGKKQSKKQTTNTAVSRRNIENPNWKPGDYDIFIYDRQQDKFVMIDKMLFDSVNHMKVSKRTEGSKKIMNIYTREILVANPDLPRLPEGFINAKDYNEVTVLNTKTKLFSKKKRYEIDDEHLEITARNDNRVRIIDSEGKGRYISKEINELYFS